MFGGDEDDDDTRGTVATRYTCMPSLVSLQQMRNRLHLANTGKKLMKWTAMATGRELRKLAKEMDETYKCFREDMRNCFMILARARYCMPHVNDIVLENIGREAEVSVKCTYRSVSGVKVLQMEIIELDVESNAHLGIGRGGEVIQEAKREWRDLLKQIILMLTERVSFIDLENANKSANKKKNVLARVVIPRTLVTMQYILDELDEMAREEFFRIKKILANKYRDRKKKGDNFIKCAFCGKVFDKTPKKTEGEEEEEEVTEIDKSDAEALKEVEKEYPFSVMCDECAEKYRNGELDIEKVESDHKPQKKVTLDPAIQEEEEIIQHTREKSIEEVLALPHKESTTSVKSFKKPDLELGTYEIEVEEITKIVRTKNEDGTVTEQKKIIKRKTERRAAPANTEPNPKTVGLVTLDTPNIWIDARKAQSLSFQTPNVSLNPAHRVSVASSIISSVSLNFLSNDSVSSLDGQQKNMAGVETTLKIHEIQNEEMLEPEIKLLGAILSQDNNNNQCKSLNKVNEEHEDIQMKSYTLDSKNKSLSKKKKQ